MRWLESEIEYWLATSPCATGEHAAAGYADKSPRASSPTVGPLSATARF